MMKVSVKIPVRQILNRLGLGRSNEARDIWPRPCGTGVTSTSPMIPAR